MYLIVSLFFQSKTVLSGSLKVANNFRVIYCHSFETQYQKFQTIFFLNCGYFWDILKKKKTYLSGFYWSWRLYQKTSESVFFSSTTLLSHLSRRSKVNVIFCDPGTFKLKFEYERTLSGNLLDIQMTYQHVSIECEI